MRRSKQDDRTLPAIGSGEIIFLVIVLAIAGFAHGFNMFDYPYYENDEGTYMSQAWAVVELGELAPYTYWYDHTPVGWLQIALWTVMTGGFFTFGFSINSGRVLMLVLHLFSSLLVYLIMRRLTQSRVAAAASVLVFSLSPLAIYFQRRVLLDNIMIFWSLLSFYLLLLYRQGAGRLRYLALSGFAFAIAVLSKETAVVLLPAFTYLVFVSARREHRQFALASWFIVLFAIVSIYPLYALLQGEFFPQGSMLSPGGEHVSLIETAGYQVGRDGGPPWLYDSHFQMNMRLWFGMDPIIMAAGIISTLFVIVAAFRSIPARMLALLSVSMWFYYLRGGLVIEFYIIDIMPFLAMNVGYMAFAISRGMTVSAAPGARAAGSVPYIVVFAMLLGMVSIGLSDVAFETERFEIASVWTADQTSAQIRAVEFMIEQGDPDDLYVIDDYAYIELHTTPGAPEAVWYWKVDRDPEVTQGVLGGTASSIDYLAETPQMTFDIGRAGLDIVQTALENARPVGSFMENGWGVVFWATLYPHRVLEDTYESYGAHFIRSGRTFATQDGIVTSSDDQGYAMLKAVWWDDRERFDEVWEWTRDNLQQSSGVFSSAIDANGVDPRSMTDADQDIALALLFASKRWNETDYLEEARHVLAGIWSEDVVRAGGSYAISSGNWAHDDETFVVNPSHVSPAHYRIFAQADPAHDWDALIDSSYEVLDVCLPDGEEVLPSNWCALDRDDLSETALRPSDPSGPFFSEEVTRLPFRLALDVRWFDDPRSSELLERFSFLEREYREDGRLINAYSTEGEPIEGFESVRMYATTLGYFEVHAPQLADDIYEDRILSKLYENLTTSYWEVPHNGNMQNWAWLATAFHANMTPNLWNPR